MFTGNITTVPLTLPNSAFPKRFTQNLPIFRDRSSLEHLLFSTTAARRQVKKKKKANLKLNLQKGCSVNPKVTEQDKWDVEGKGGAVRVNTC